MSESVFRKKNLDRIKTPDTLDQYIQVANPGGWILLACVLCLLIGVIVWGVFGTIETTLEANALVENGAAVLTLSDERIADIETGMFVRIGDTEGMVWKVFPDAGTVTAKIDVPDGAYDAEIITEVIKPMSLIFD